MRSLSLPARTNRASVPCSGCRPGSSPRCDAQRILVVSTTATTPMSSRGDPFLSAPENSPTMLPPTPLMYAELLANIRQISVIVALQEPCDPATKAELSGDGQRFILHHAGEASSLSLPGRVSPTAQLQAPALGSNELTWRLPLAGQPTRASWDSAQNNDPPWSAKGLGDETEFSCRDCGAIIVSRGSIKTWRDLPSENWAEMMDFWHCHKPHVPEENGFDGHDGNVGDEKSLANRGYGANMKFIPTTGIGFVDLTTFLLTDSDCTNIQVESSRDVASKHQTVSCSVCRHYVGYIDHEAAGSRIYKWRLQPTPKSTLLSNSTSSNASNSPSLASIISAQLVASMQSQGLSRFVLLPAQWTPTSQVSKEHSHNLFSPMSDSLQTAPTISSAASYVSEDSEDMYSMEDDRSGWGPLHVFSHCTFLSLWILTSNLRFSRNTTRTKSESRSSTSASSTTTQVDCGTPAMKVFWKTVSAKVAEAIMQSNAVEELFLPTEAICEIENCLRSSSQLLPPSARKFQDWDVGLLERYDK